MIEYTVIYERGETNWGAYIPDLLVASALAIHLPRFKKILKKRS